MTRNERQTADRKLESAIVRRIRQACAAIDAQAPHIWRTAPEWYPSALRDGATVCPSDALRGAAMIACLSPRTTYAQHIAGGVKMIAAAAAGEPEPVVAGFTANRAKAWRIACGEAVTDVLRGLKVNAFLTNIGDTFTGDPADEPVTCDVWIARLAYGIAPADWTPKDGVRGGRSGYALLERAVRRVAAERDMRPRDLQAALWIHIRGRAS